MYITDESDIECLRDIILRRKLFRNQGKDVETHCSLFEKNFAEKIGTSHSLLVTSGTNALICALTSLEFKPGDEILIPTYTFVATAAAVINAKLIPVLVNIDAKLAIDPIDIENKITAKTKAIIAVHMDGRPCDMKAILEISKKYNLMIIEDVAQAVGGQYFNRRLGSIGEMGCFSFNVDKIISCGEGGAVTTNNRIAYERSLCIQDTACSFGPTFKDSFQTIKPFIGQSMRVSEISGALINNQLYRLDFILNELRIRKNIICNILKLKSIDIIDSHDNDGECGTSIYLKFNSIEECKKQFIKLNRHQIYSYPISMKPAHVFWQWADLLRKHEASFKYNKSHYLNSIDLLTTTLKIVVPFELTLEQTEEYAQVTSSILATR